MTAQRYLAVAFAYFASLGVLHQTHAMDQHDMSLNPLKAVDRAALKGFLERPLFDPSRRQLSTLPPQHDEIEPAPAPVEEPPRLHLLGVIHGEGDMAVVQRDGQSKAVIVCTGDHLDGWVLQILPPFRLRLTHGNRAVEFSLFGKTDLRPSALVAEPDNALAGETNISGSNCSRPPSLPPQSLISSERKTVVRSLSERE